MGNQRGSVSAIRQLAKAANKMLKTTTTINKLPPRKNVYTGLQKRTALTAEGL